MHFSAVFITTAIFSASSSYAWTYSNGVWVANNVWYPLAGGECTKPYQRGRRRSSSTLIYVGYAHEACTYQGTSNIHQTGDGCAYFINGNGNVYNGRKFIYLHLKGSISPR